MFYFVFPVLEAAQESWGGFRYNIVFNANFYNKIA